jgi:hypothetical protein
VRILVTGCGRAGTQYTFRLLSVLGLRASHEKVYNHDLDPKAPPLERIEERWNMLDAESSWLAVPFCRTLPENVVVWHQLRDPLKVVRCFLHTHILSSHDAACRFIQGVFPECGQEDDLTRSVQYVLRWTRMLCDFGRLWPNYFGYRMEAVTPEHWQALLAAAGRRFTVGQVRDAIKRLPEQIGACGHAEDDHPPSWDTVRSVAGGEELYALAKELGYDG